MLTAAGSVFTNKYSEGYPGRRYYGGQDNTDKVENLAIERAKKLFGADHANVQPHSGSQANMAVYFSVLQPGDRILSTLPLSHQFAQWLVGVCAPLAGAAVITLPRFDAAHYWQTMEQEDITHLPAVPAQYLATRRKPRRSLRHDWLT